MKKILKVNLKHPAKSFQLGRHRVGVKPEEYDLNESELKELETAGPKKWLIVVEEKKKTPAKKKSKDPSQ